MCYLKAIILAAGEGKRLEPLTNNIPKCMVKLFGRSLLDWQIITMKNCNIDDIVIVTGYRSNFIKIPNIRHYKNENYKNTNMVETLFCAKKELNDSVIISYGDIIFEKKVLQALLDSKEDISVIIDENWEPYWEKRFNNPLDNAESLIVDENFFIKDIGQKVKSKNEICGQYIGLLKFQGNSLKIIKQFYEDSKKKSQSAKNPLNPNLPFEKSYMTDFLRGLIKAGCKLKAIKTYNGWLELDTFHDYEIYNQMYADGTISQFFSVENIDNNGGMINLE